MQLRRLVEYTVMTKNTLLTLVLLMLCVSPARPQAPSEDIPKLKARIDKLEAENAAIKSELAELKKQLAALQGGSRKPPQPEETDHLRKPVHDFFEDINKGRLLSAYRSMSQPYLKRTERTAFDAFVEKHKSLLLKGARIGFGDTPQYQFRKLAKDNAYECDIVMPDVGGPSNMTVRLIEEEGVWKIDEFVELRERKKP